MYRSNKNRLLQGNNALSGGAPKKYPGLSVITKNVSSVKTSRSNSNINLELSAKKTRSNINLSASFLSLQNTPPPHPTQNLFENTNLNLPNQYSKISFNKKNFKNKFSTGKQSNMMVSLDNTFYFKKYSSKQPTQTKKNLENECRVYAYLRNTSPEFL